MFRFEYFLHFLTIAPNPYQNAEKNIRINIGLSANKVMLKKERDS